VRDCDAWWVAECSSAQQAELAFAAAIAILDQPGALEDARALETASRALDEHRAWMTQERRFQLPWGTTSAFRKMAARHGYPTGRRRQA
jgi:hypothetical protein